jgi:hypothetical protein
MLVRRFDRVRKLIGCLLIAIVAAGYRAATDTSTPPAAQPAIFFLESPTPFTGVVAGDVRALIPDQWHARLADPAGGFEQGFIASPAIDGPRGQVAEGMAAVWIDGTRVGVPSDFYYLAAKHAAVDRLTQTTGCDALTRTILNHRPSYAHGRPNSPGDYLALGTGVCSQSDRPTRFAYFVAAPGYGPLHRIGIPASGLYVVVAVVPDTPDAPTVLQKLLYGTRFGTASITDLIRAAKTGRSL